ncbi:MAG: hypothetical protein ACI4Q4_06390 [Oscillospiraceae bacterium]
MPKYKNIEDYQLAIPAMRGGGRRRRWLPWPLTKERVFFPLASAKSETRTLKSDPWRWSPAPRSPRVFCAVDIDDGELLLVFCRADYSGWSYLRPDKLDKATFELAFQQFAAACAKGKVCVP